MSRLSVAKEKSCSWLRTHVGETNYSCLSVARNFAEDGSEDDRFDDKPADCADDEWGMDVVDDNETDEADEDVVDDDETDEADEADGDLVDDDETDEADDEEHREYDPMHWPTKYKKRKTTDVRKRAVRMRVTENAAPEVLAFLEDKGLLEYLMAALGGDLKPRVARTAFNRMAYLLTWTWEKTGKSRAGLSTTRHIMRHLEAVFLSDRLDLVEAYTNHLRDECDMQPGTLANILDHLEKGFKWFCTDLRRDVGYALGTVHEQLATLRRKYRHEQILRNLQVTNYYV
jgi:hypothetical protein